MDVTPLETGSLLSKVAEQGALFSFMLLVIIGLAIVIRTLYNRNILQGDVQARAMTDSTIAINNNNVALNALTKQIERLNDAR